MGGSMRRVSRWLGITAALTACSGGVGTTGGGPGPGDVAKKGIGDGEIPGMASAGDTGSVGETAGVATGGASSSSGSSSGGASSGGSAPPVVPGPSAGGASDTASSATAFGGDAGVPAGILTAGTWDENRNFDLFLSYRSQMAPTLPGAPPLSEQEHRDAFAIWSAVAAPRTTLDVSLVIDTTGSMGDEMDYLRSEFLAMHATIESKYPAAEQRWSLVVYKDVVDPYIVRWFDFRTDPNDFVAHLAAQTAGGGGDYPESPERALAITSQLAWRGASTAKLAFWVTDAPHHDMDAAVMAQSLRGLRDAGVHLYPVAASGADDLTELTMREGAQLTGGRFLFLTDDSGVGDAHAVPRVPCFFVTKLDAAILRMVDIELTGKYREPDASEVIRTGGDPQSGRCSLADGQAATVF
jgi:hypothetical protein